MTHFNESGLWAKIKKSAKQAGLEVIEKALWLYYAAQNPETPAWAKTTIYGALAYFISPLDAIPDFTPVVGYADDVAVLAAAIAAVSIYITEEVKEMADNKLNIWFA